jgi:ATP-dependent protease ClpP protease subunit
MSEVPGINFLYNRRKRSKKVHKKRKLSKTFEDLLHETFDDDEDDVNDMEEYNYSDNGVSSKHNSIYFKTAVNDNSVESLIKIIESKVHNYKKLTANKSLKSAKPAPIYLHITSFGGSLLACFRAIDAIQRSEIPIYTVIDGYAASAGTLMSVVGKKRFMTPSSYMLIHQLSSGSIGKYWEIKDDFENCETWMNDIYDIYLENTNLSREQLEEYLSHDLWWKADKCIETGLIDDLYTENMGV